MNGKSTIWSWGGSWLLVSLLVLGACACSGAGAADGGLGDGDGDASVDGDGAQDGDGTQDGDGAESLYPPARQGMIPLDGQMLFPVKLDGQPQTYWLVVDTGAFGTAIEETLVRDLENGVGVVSIDFGEGIEFVDHRVFGADLSKAVDHIGVEIHGLIGQDIFMPHFFGLDYQQVETTMAMDIPPVPPPGFSAADAVEVAYALEQLMPVVEVEIDGQTARLIADTGSGVTLLAESFVPQALLDQGVTGYVWHTSYGSDPATLVRLPQMSVGGHSVPDSWAVVVPDEHHLKAVFEALGVFVDGFLGFPVYRRFYVSVHGPESRYLFYPYADLTHLPTDEWDRVGIEIKREVDQVLVDMVFSPSNAADQGVLPGDAIQTIAGQDLSGMPLDDIRRLMRGTPGELRTITFQRGADPAYDRDLSVDRLLPPLILQ